MKEKERNLRLFKLLSKLVKKQDLEAIELIETMIENETPSMKKSFDIVKRGGNFNFKENKNSYQISEDGLIELYRLAYNDGFDQKGDKVLITEWREKQIKKIKNKFCS